ncbi:MAG: hypothetical protein OSB38_30480 [Paraburkholderia fungorum]|nr:hypothetical protein [Paraburkholderia fungorum]
MKLNPNHPVTQMLDDEFMHKLAAVLVMQAGGEATITMHDLQALVLRFGGDEPTLVTHCHADSIELKLVCRTEAERLAREHGGLPQ